MNAKLVKELELILNNLQDIMNLLSKYSLSVSHTSRLNNIYSELKTEYKKLSKLIYGK